MELSFEVHRRNEQTGPICQVPVDVVGIMDVHREEAPLHPFPLHRMVPGGMGYHVGEFGQEGHVDAVSRVTDGRIPVGGHVALPPGLVSRAHLVRFAQASTTFSRNSLFLISSTY